MRPRLFLLLAIVLGLAIRLYRLDQRSIWFDEASSWRTSQFPFGEMLERIAANCHPPLYYLCLKGWTALFGDSLWALRGLSVLFSGVLIAAVYLLVCEMYQHARDPAARAARWAAVFAASLVAFHPFQIRMAWEARMYMLGAALAVLSSWLLLVAWRRQALPFWLAYGFAAVLLAYTHYYGLFTVFAQVLFLGCALFGEHRGKWSELFRGARMRGATASVVVFILASLPWLPTFFSQRQQIEDSWWTGTFNPESLLSVAQTMMLGDGGRGWLAVVAVGVVLLIAVAAFAAATRAGDLLGLLIVCPILLSTTYSLWFRNIIVDRYFTFTHVFVLVGAAVLVARIGNSILRNSVAAMLVAGSFLAYYDMWTRLDIVNRPGARAVAEVVLTTAEHKEPVVVSSSLIYYPMLYYLRDQVDCRLVRSGPLSHNRGGPFAKEEDFIDADELVRIQGTRAWLITGGWGDREVEIPNDWLLVRSETFREVFRFQGSVTVSEYRIDAQTAKVDP